MAYKVIEVNRVVLKEELLKAIIDMVEDHIDNEVTVLASFDAATMLIGDLRACSAKSTWSFTKDVPPPLGIKFRRFCKDYRLFYGSIVIRVSLDELEFANRILQGID
jgi:hypothetical protein